MSDLTHLRFDYEREKHPLSAQRELRPERSSECKSRSEVEGHVRRMCILRKAS